MYFYPTIIIIVFVAILSHYLSCYNLQLFYNFFLLSKAQLKLPLILKHGRIHGYLVHIPAASLNFFLFFFLTSMIKLYMGTQKTALVCLAIRLIKYHSGTTLGSPDISDFPHN